jgi:hypothetical protein
MTISLGVRGSEGAMGVMSGLLLESGRDFKRPSRYYESVNDDW